MAMPSQPPSRLLVTSMHSMALRFHSKGNVRSSLSSHSCDLEVNRDVSQAGNVCRSASIQKSQSDRNGYALTTYKLEVTPLPYALCVKG